MAFGFAGAGAGATNALEEIIKEQMVRAQMAQREKEHADRMGLEQQQLAEAIRRSGIAENQAQQRVDLDARVVRERDNQRGVRRMLGEAIIQRPGGITPEDRRSMAALQVEAGDEPSLLNEPPAPRRNTHVVSGNLVDDDGTVLFTAPKDKPTGEASPKKQIWVKRGDQVVPIQEGTAQPGDVPYDQVASRQAPEKDAANQKAVDALKTYGDNLLDAIDELIDANGNLKPDVAGVVGGFDGARPEWAYLKEGSQGALAKINRIQALLNIDTLRDMKAQSRTGATGFGALTEKELAIVESSAATLRNRRQSDPAYAAELKRVRDEVLTGRGTGPRKPADGDAVSAAQALIDKARAARGGKPQ